MAPEVRGRAKERSHLLLDVPYYAQTAEFSCGPACAVMLLDHFNGTKPSRELEFEVWREVNMIGVPGCDPFSLALALNRRGLGVKIFAENAFDIKGPQVKRLEKLFGKQAPELLQFAVAQSMKKVQKEKLEWVKRPPTRREVSEALEDKIVPVYMLMMHEAPHWIIIEGEGKGGYVINDPYYEDGGGPGRKISYVRFEGCLQAMQMAMKISPGAVFVSSS